MGRVAPLIIIPPNSFYVYEKSPRERPASDSRHPQLLSSCNYTIRPDCRLKVIIDQGVLMARGPPGAHSATASSFLSLCCLSRDKQCSWVENPSDLTGPLSTNTKVFLVLWTLLPIRVSLEVLQAPWNFFLCIFLFIVCPPTEKPGIITSNGKQCKRLSLLCLFACFSSVAVTSASRTPVVS